MPQKMDLWHSGLALAKYGPALTTIGLVTGFLVAKITLMPNFSLLAPPHAPEDGPVVLQAGPDPLEVCEEVRGSRQQLLHDPLPIGCIIQVHSKHKERFSGTYITLHKEIYVHT